MTTREIKMTTKKLEEIKKLYDQMSALGKTKSSKSNKYRLSSEKVKIGYSYLSAIARDEIEDKLKQIIDITKKIEEGKLKFKVTSIENISNSKKQFPFENPCHGYKFNLHLIKFEDNMDGTLLSFIPRLRDVYDIMTKNFRIGPYDMKKFKISPYEKIGAIGTNKIKISQMEKDLSAHNHYYAVGLNAKKLKKKDQNRVVILWNNECFVRPYDSPYGHKVAPEIYLNSHYLSVGEKGFTAFCKDENELVECIKNFKTTIEEKIINKSQSPLSFVSPIRIRTRSLFEEGYSLFKKEKRIKNEQNKQTNLEKMIGYEF